MDFEQKYQKDPGMNRVNFAHKTHSALMSKLEHNFKL